MSFGGLEAGELPAYPRSRPNLLLNMPPVLEPVGRVLFLEVSRAYMISSKSIWLLMLYTYSFLMKINNCLTSIPLTGYATFVVYMTLDGILRNIVGYLLCIPVLPHAHYLCVYQS